MVATDVRGVVVPILTPLTTGEKVDKPSLRRLVSYLLDNGVHGIWASGTTGEFANLPDTERLVSIETVVDEVAGRVLVIANVSGPSTAATIDLGRSAGGIGVAGVAATPPYYFPSEQEELLDHYRHIRQSLDQPLWVYNIPQTVKSAVAPQTIVKLAAEGAVVGVKDSSGGGETLAHLNVLCTREGVELYRFLGTAFRVTSARAVGAHGVIPGIANLVPAAAAQGWEAGEAGDTETARRCEGDLLTVSALSSVAGGGSTWSKSMASMKSALKIMGVIDDDRMSQPMRRLTDDEKRAIPEVLASLGLTARAAV